MEQECLSIVLGIKAFEVYLIGKPSVLQTDHTALQWIQQCSTHAVEFDVATLHLYSSTHKGSQNANADALSRLQLNYPHSLPEKGEGNMTGVCAEDIAD